MPFFLSKKCPFKVKHTVTLFVEERAFSSILKSLNANCLPLTGHSKIEKAQSGQRAPLCLNGAFILSHLRPYNYGDDGTGKLSREPFLIAPEGAKQSRAVEALFFLKEKGIFLNI